MPGAIRQRMVSGSMPSRARTVSQESTSTSARKLPEYTRDMPMASPLASVVDGRRSRMNGFCWWPVEPRWLRTARVPAISGASTTWVSRPQAPVSCSRCQSESGRSSTALMAVVSVTSLVPSLTTRMLRVTTGRSA